MNRRRALFTLTGLAAVAGGALLLCQPADAHHPTYTAPPQHNSEYSVSVEYPGGSTFPNFWHGGSMYVAGDIGSPYVLRVNNHSGQRIEAVVTVDGRDVISGELGDYRKHRGYIVEPYGSVSIDGFRQSMDHVASFRFSAQSESYSARRGTPQHVGVIGVAVFKEYRRQKRRSSRPIQTHPHPHPYPNRPYYDRSGAADEAEASSKSNKRKSGGRAGSPSAGAAESAPYYDDYDYSRPSRRERLGTEYGETRYSSVREVSFKRRNKRRPDVVLTTYYDSLEGLRSRGIPVDPYYYPQPDPYPYYDPEPFPKPGFAPPPPRRY